MHETLRYLLPAVQLADPHLCTDSHAVLSIRRLLFQGLVSHTGRKAEGVLAHSWTCGNGGRSWTFYLRKGIFFPEGKEMDAGDVVYSLKRAVSPEREGQLFTVTYHAYIGQAAFTIMNPHEVRLENPDPIADLLEFLPDLSILPEGWEGYSDGTGTGPFTIAEQAENRVLLKPRDARRPYLEFREERNQTLRTAAVVSGEADYALDPSLEQEASFPAACRWDTSVCVVFLMNCGTQPLDDVRVRQAVNLAVDKKRMIQKVLLGHAKPLNGPLSDRHFGWDPGTSAYPFDPDAAKKLLNEAGCGLGFPLTVHAPRSIPEEGPKLAEFVAGSLREIGIDAAIVLHDDRTEYARKIAEKELDGIFCFDSSPLSTYKVLKEKLDSRETGTWWQGYENGEFNTLLSEAAGTVEDGARRHLYQRAYRILREDAPWLFLYQSVRYWAARKDGGGGQAAFDDLGFPAFSGQVQGDPET